MQTDRTDRFLLWFARVMGEVCRFHQGKLAKYHLGIIYPILRCQQNRIKEWRTGVFVNSELMLCALLLWFALRKSWHQATSCFVCHVYFKWSQESNSSETRNLPLFWMHNWYRMCTIPMCPQFLQAGYLSWNFARTQKHFALVRFFSFSAQSPWLKFCFTLQTKWVRFITRIPNEWQLEQNENLQSDKVSYQFFSNFQRGTLLNKSSVNDVAFHSYQNLDYTGITLVYANKICNMNICSFSPLTLTPFRIRGCIE